MQNDMTSIPSIDASTDGNKGDDGNGVGDDNGDDDDEGVFLDDSSTILLHGITNCSPSLLIMEVITHQPARTMMDRPFSRAHHCIQGRLMELGSIGRSKYSTQSAKGNYINVKANNA